MHLYFFWLLNLAFLLVQSGPLHSLKHWAQYPIVCPSFCSPVQVLLLFWQVCQTEGQLDSLNFAERMASPMPCQVTSWIRNLTIFVYWLEEGECVCTNSVAKEEVDVQWISSCLHSCCVHTWKKVNDVHTFFHVVIVYHWLWFLCWIFRDSYFIVHRF